MLPLQTDVIDSWQGLPYHNNKASKIMVKYTDDPLALLIGIIFYICGTVLMGIGIRGIIWLLIIGIALLLIGIPLMVWQMR